MSKKKWKRRIFDIIQIGSKDDLPSRVFDIVLVAVIVLNILVLFLETFDGLSAWRGTFKAVVIVTMMLFCV